MLEITESILFEDLEQSVNLLHPLNHMDVRVAIDDFGTGFSSLQYLQCLPIDALKIDKSFIHDVTANAGSAAIVEAVIKLAKTFNLQIIAEGSRAERICDSSKNVAVTHTRDFCSALRLGQRHWRPTQKSTQGTNELNLPAG